jgi:hypothetical protein
MRALALACLCLLLQACTHIGPGTVTRDRVDYNAAISDSWKEQTLLNVVKLRYADMPVFMEVASVVSGYQLEGSVSLGGAASSQSVQGDFLNFGTTGKYIERPTITYQPITGSQFNRSFMTPIPPRMILFLLHAGWSADLIFPLTVDSINGLRAQVATGLNRRAGDADYYAVVRLLSALQRSGAVGMQIRKGAGGMQKRKEVPELQEDTTVLFFYRDALAPETRKDVADLNRLLGLEPKAEELSVIYGRVPRSRQEIAMTTLSMLQIMIKLAALTDVPPEDVAAGSTVPSSGATRELDRIISIRQGSERPDRPFVSIRYRDHWFWIEDTDYVSKRTFTFLMVLFSMAETGGHEGLPLVTIPAG